MSQTFSIGQWIAAVKTDPFQTPDEVQEEIRQLGFKIMEVCKANNITFHFSFTSGGTETMFQLQSISNLAPLERLPLELIVQHQMTAGGVAKACEMGLDIIDQLNSKEVPDDHTTH